MAQTPPRHSSSLVPSTPRTRSRPRSYTDRVPVPAFAGPRISRPSTPEGRYPPVSLLPSNPSTPLRNELTRHNRTASTATLIRAAQIALPDTPPQTFLGSTHLSDLELCHLPPRQDRHNSPFHDRHSIEMLEEEHSPSKQRVRMGYQFAGMRGVSPGGDYKEELDFGEELEVHISEKRRSLYPVHPTHIPASTLHDHPDLMPSEPMTKAPLAPASMPPVRPRFRGLFTYSTPRDFVLLFVPGILISGAAALSAPFMSQTIGDIFEIMAAYPLQTETAIQAQRDAMYGSVLNKTFWLVGAAGYTIVTNYTKAVIWQWHGEVLTARLRQKVFEGVQRRRMQWFDTGMGMGDEDGGQQAVGAGGLMAKFSRETDDVRMGCSQMMGSFFQNFLTFLFCFILALSRSPVLALVTLSTIPLVVLVQIITQVVVGPLLAVERRAFAEGSTDIERSTNAISTVKAHNAQTAEETRFERIIARAKASLIRQAVVWGLSLSVTDFLLLGTFVSGFWYGAKLVQDGSITSGTVMTVFWAALLAASYLQSTIPCLTLMTKAKMSMASLRTVIQEEAVEEKGISLKRPMSMSKIQPQRCHGEFNFRNVSFAYPSRRDIPVLRDITLFIPPSETTFIVGGSGSGKSTIAQLLLRLYTPDGGDISLDDQSFLYLDEGFTRDHIAAVQQGCILFDMSVHDNVALGLAGAPGRAPRDVTRDEVVQACRTAMIHDFVAGLPDGYETNLGTGGSSLSGGQKQRLAIARAVIRDPTVLILDEATSALDATSRVAVFENLKRWRTNRTTIVITHDLSHIVADDFVYVMRNGIVAEQGFRSDLMRKSPAYGEEFGVFASMAAEQAVQPLPPKLEVNPAIENSKIEVLQPSRPGSMFRGSVLGRPQSMAYYDILDEYSRGVRTSITADRTSLKPRPLSVAQKRLSWAPNDLNASKVSVYGSKYGSQVTLSRPASRMSGQSSQILSRQVTHTKTPYTLDLHSSGQNLEDDLKAVSVAIDANEDRGPPPGIFKILFFYLPGMPRKILFVIGLVGSLAHGVSTPIWSAYLSRLMAIVAGGGTDPMLNTYALVVLAISAGQALANYTQEYALYTVGVQWSTQIRQTAYQRILFQDRTFFDQPINAPAMIVQNLVKDVDDLRNLVSTISGKFVLFVSMVGLGIIWAMAVQWRLTLVGLALAPVFAAIVVLNEVMVGRAEVRNKEKRDKVAKLFYEVSFYCLLPAKGRMIDQQSVSNVRGIRAMALEGTFSDRFAEEAKGAETTGKSAGWFVGIGVAASACLPLAAMALLNWVGCLFMLDNHLNYQQMLMVFNLILFSLTFGSQALDFVPLLAKVKVAARDFGRLYTLPLNTTESSGTLRFPISGHISFESVDFAYPTRPTVPVLSNLSFRLTPGECVAIVGPSGSGKSTIAALLQRLYEPSRGHVRMDRFDLSAADTKWLRNHIAVVSQTANLFDATVAENIAYGSDIPIGEIHRAAKAANIHDFITSLPQGYDTNLGENASLISGGQAQRLQIARALVRRSNILILDEATSALDVDNQRAILDTILKIKDTCTTIFITHSVEAMKRCDRIICLDEGKVAEDGSFGELIAKGGVFAQLMHLGEWE